MLCTAEQGKDVCMMLYGLAKYRFCHGKGVFLVMRMQGVRVSVTLLRRGLATKDTQPHDNYTMQFGHKETRQNNTTDKPEDSCSFIFKML